jgi:hypothetical protein
MTEDLWTDRLSDYLDGDMDADERAQLEDHLVLCAACSSTLAELSAVVGRARALRPTEPKHDLWPGIASAIGAGQRPDVLPLAARRARRVTFSLPQLAAATVVLVFGSALAGRSFLRSEPDAPVAAAPAAIGPAGATLVAQAAPPPGYAEELERLQLALERGRAQLDPNTVRILEKNLEVIDRAIRESQAALAVDPGNVFLEQHLERAYRGKMDYLREANAMLTWGV